VFAHRGARAAAQEVDDIFGDPDDLLELYERGKAARGAGGARPGAEPEEAPEPPEGEDGEEGVARQAAFAQRQVRLALEPGRAGAAAQQPCQAEGGCKHADEARAGRRAAAPGVLPLPAAPLAKQRRPGVSSRACRVVWRRRAFGGICPDQMGPGSDGRR